MPVKLCPHILDGEVLIEYQNAYNGTSTANAMRDLVWHHVQEIELRQLRRQPKTLMVRQPVEWADARYEREYPNDNLYGVYLRRGPLPSLHFAEHLLDIDGGATVDGKQLSPKEYAILLAAKHGCRAYLHSPSRGKILLEGK